VQRSFVTIDPILVTVIYTQLNNEGIKMKLNINWLRCLIWRIFHSSMPYVRPEYFGARYNSEDDDGPAINEAMKCAGGRPILFMNEEYVIRSPIVFQWSENNTPTPIFRGIGKLKTILRSEIPEGGPIIKLTPVDPCDFIFGIGTVIEDICFKGPQEVAPTTHSAIMVGALVEFVIQRCWFEDFPREAFCVENRCAGGNLGDAGSIARFTLDELYALRCATKRGYTFDTGLQNTVGIIRRCVADQCGGGFHVKPSAIVMDMCSANYCTHREGFKFAAAGASLSKHPVLNSLSCEGNAAGDINLQSCAGAIINAPRNILPAII
jgi:hypothetical protein